MHDEILSCSDGSFLPVVVNKSKPFSSRQCTKHTSHDEAPSAQAVWTSSCPAQVWMWSQKKPSEGLFFIYHCLSEAWQPTCGSVTEFAVRPAFGSAGWARTDELVSVPCFIGVFFFFFFLKNVQYFNHFNFFISEHQELERRIDATQTREHREDLQGDLERLVARMEEKSAQISKLRKHQQTVCERSLL